MYPPQTSFIPVQVALARFLESQGLKAVVADYPYWYLGTTPFRYLTGPILPFLMMLIHRLFPGENLFTVFYLILGMAWPLGGVGIYLLLRTLMGADKKPISADEISENQDQYQRKSVMIAAVPAILFVFGPVVPFLFRFSNGLSLISFAFLPYALSGYVHFLRKDTGKNRLILVALISFLLLLDISIFSTLFLGMMAVFLTITGWKKAEKKAKASLMILIYSLVIVTFWYGPGYWWQMFFAPSFAGRSLLSVISQIGQLLPIALAITLAAVSGRFFKPKKNGSKRISYQVSRFSFFWLFIFGFLTLIRFISDPDFWLDWMSYGIELQLGLAIFGAWAVGRLGKLGRLGGLLLLAFNLAAFGFIGDRYILKKMQENIEKSVEYRIGRVLMDVDEGALIGADCGPVSTGGDCRDYVFLSGTTVFWLNAFFDIPQVRGGNDGPSVNPQWREVAWEVREGQNPEDSIERLGALGVTYLVVHTENSAEFWHDFKNPVKFEKAEGVNKVYEEFGDIIYQLE